MDHNYKVLTGFQVGEIVRVEKEKEVFWKGVIVKIHTAGTLANVRNINQHSIYFDCVYCVRIDQLKIWDPADDVNC